MTSSSFFTYTRIFITIPAAGGAIRVKRPPFIYNSRTGTPHRRRKTRRPSKNWSETQKCFSWRPPPTGIRGVRRYPPNIISLESGAIGRVKNTVRKKLNAQPIQSTLTTEISRLGLYRTMVDNRLSIELVMITYGFPVATTTINLDIYSKIYSIFQ